jgi:hypothetical protein
MVGRIVAYHIVEQYESPWGATIATQVGKNGLWCPNPRLPARRVRFRLSETSKIWKLCAMRNSHAAMETTVNTCKQRAYESNLSKFVILILTLAF